MRILIVEDEPLAAERLQDLIFDYESHIEVVAVKDSVKGTLKWLQENPTPDLGLFDIQLADGLSFLIFEQRRIEFPVIFTTAYDEYAIQAFKVNSVDYLLKPLEFDDLANAMDKFVKIHMPLQQTPTALNLETIQQLIQSVQRPQNYKERFVVKQGERLHSIQVKDILYFYAEDKYSFFRTVDNRRFLLDQTLGEIESQINPSHFFRLNRQYLVSHSSIADIISYTHSRLKVKLQHSEDNQIIVSKQKVASFKEWLGA